MSDDFGTGPLHCRHCGKRPHMFSWECPRNLHDEDDPFKTSCAACGEEIPSGAPRESDKYHNLYCDVECLADGLEALLEDVVEAQQEREARA